MLCGEVDFPLPDAAHYRRALEGIASCATQCGCCEMHKRIAQEALAK